MEFAREVVAWLVASIGLVGWVTFLPQIRLLLKVKEAKSISLGLLWGSFAMQAIILVHVAFAGDWKLALVYITGLMCLVVILSLTYYYRRWPGGRAA
jgi:uncharacterized protein with PQ loop repeat